MLQQNQLYYSFEKKDETNTKVPAGTCPTVEIKGGICGEMVIVVGNGTEFKT